MSCRRESGYTLIEILVVTTVIAIIMASVLPAFLIAKKQANESAAIASLRSISRAQLQHRTRYGSFTDIAALESTSLLDVSYQDGEKIGYQFASTEAPSPATWSATATPITPTVTGDRYFFIDESGVIRYREGSPAGENDSAIE